MGRDVSSGASAARVAAGTTRARVPGLPGRAAITSWGAVAGAKRSSHIFATCCSMASASWEGRLFKGRRGSFAAWNWYSAVRSNRLGPIITGRILTPTVLRGLQQGRQLDCIDKIGGKEIGAHQQDSDTGAIEIVLNFGTPYIAWFDRRVSSDINFLCLLEGSQKRFQTVEPYVIGVIIANKNVVPHSLGWASIHTSDLLEMKFVDDNASV